MLCLFNIFLSDFFILFSLHISSVFSLCHVFVICHHPSRSGLSAVSLSQGLQLSALKLAHTHHTHTNTQIYKPLKQWQKYMNIKQETIFPHRRTSQTQMYVWHLSRSSPEKDCRVGGLWKISRMLSPRFVSFSLRLFRSFNVSEPRLDHMVTAEALLFTVSSLGQKQGAHSGK